MAELLTELLTSGAIVGASLIAAIGINKFTARAIRRYAPKRIREEITTIITTPLGVAIVLVGLGASLLRLDLVQAIPILARATSIGLSLAWTFLGGLVAYRLVGSFLDHLANLRKETYPTMAGVLKPVGTVIRLLIAISILLTILGIAGVDISPYIMGWGLLGFAIVLALQPVLQDFVSGLYFSLAQPYKVGDMVQLPSGEICEISDIKAQQTVLYNLADKVFIRISNTELMSSRIVSPGQEGMRLSVPFKVTQDSDIELAKKVVYEIVEALPQVAERPKPSVYVMQLDGPAVALQLVCWIENPSVRYEVVDEINTQLIRRFREAGIRFLA